MSKSEYCWTSDWKTASAEQEALSVLLRTEPLPASAQERVLAVGVAYSEKTRTAHCAALPCTFEGKPLNNEDHHAAVHVDFPYMPGLFAYREGPAVCAMLGALKEEPTLLLMDSQGLAHPRSFGLAAHIGVACGIPTMGMTKKPLVGRLPKQLPEYGVVSMKVQGKTACLALIRPEADPVFASPGHMASFKDAERWLRSMPRDGRGLPSALGRAHSIANKRSRS